MDPYLKALIDHSVAVTQMVGHAASEGRLPTDREVEQLERSDAAKALRRERMKRQVSAARKEP